MPRKILMIDDDRIQFRLTQAHVKGFRREVYEMEWASSYEEGIEKLLSGNFAACLLDYQLGPKDGLQLIREALARGCRTPIVFLTAEASDRVDIEAMNAGALDFLVKGEINSPSLERSLRYALKLGETLEALKLMATRDEMTGLANRREFDRVLEQEQERALRFGQPLALVMADVDYFKSFNDEGGHAKGDAVLKRVAEVLKANVRTVDFVARHGGDEFAVILLQTGREAALAAAQRFCTAVAEAGGGITLSAGAAAMPDDAASGAELAAAADRALYAAKERGRNRAEAFARA